MTTPLHYQYSEIYLAEHMQRISRCIVLVGSVAISAFLVVAGVYRLVDFIIN